MYRTKAEQAIFAERDRLVDNRTLTKADRARLDELQNLIREMPTCLDPEEQAASDFVRQAAATLESALSIDEGLRKHIARLYKTNYRLREENRQLRIRLAVKSPRTVRGKT